MLSTGRPDQVLFEIGRSQGLGLGLEIHQTHLGERSAYTEIDSLPGMSHATNGLQLAVAVRGAALGDGDGAFQGVDDLGGTDLLGRPGQGIATPDTSFGYHQARPNQSFEQLTDRGLSQMGSIGHVVGAGQRGLAGQLGED